MKQFSILFILIISVWACSDSIDVEAVTPPDLPKNDTTTNDGDDDDEVNDSYFYPLAVGNEWTYNSNGEELTMEIQSENTSDDTTKYQIVNSANGSSAPIFSVDKQHYFFLGNTTSGRNIESNFLLLDENVAMGEQWRDSISFDNGFLEEKHIYVYTMVEVHDSHELENGDSYDDVLKVKLEQYYIADGLFDETKIYEGNYYWAKGVGLIELTIEAQDVDIPDFGSRASSSMYLTSYTLQ